MVFHDMLRPWQHRANFLPKMSNCTYLYTDLGPQEIRVFNLLPATSTDAPLECEVLIRKRDDALKYEAVSYVWGSGEGPFTQLKVRSTPENRFNANKHFFIGPSLAAALKRKSKSLSLSIEGVIVIYLSIAMRSLS